MRNTEYTPVTKNIEVVQSVTCNKCGKTFTPDEEDEFLDIHKVDVRFEGERNRYHSKCWWFDLCDTCLIDFVKTFKHAPDWFNGSIGEGAQKEFEKWIEKDGDK